MNPVVIDIGPLELREYAAWITGGMLLGFELIAWRAWIAEREIAALARWFDVGIAALIAGLIGARALHVALDWGYFADHTDEIGKLRLGGLAWQGGLLAALPVVVIAARLRGVPLRAWTDASALALPPVLAATWRGCRNAGCAYGYEVDTLANYRSWQVAELPDIFGQVAPRLDIHAVGVALGVGLFALLLLLTWRDWLPGYRLWIGLALAGIALLVLGYLRADPAPTLAGQRADQTLNALVTIGSTLIGGSLWLWDRRSAAQTPDEVAAPGAAA